MATQNTFDIQEIKTIKGAKITVIGVGGGGTNTITHLINTGAHKDVKLVVANTDIQHLEKSPAPFKVQLGAKITNGLGAGMKPEVGKEAAQESASEIKNILEGSEIVIIAAGLGGGTGTGAAPIIAKIAKEIKAVTISIVTKPFKFEGSKRMRFAEDGLKELKEASDSIIVIPNDKLLSIGNKQTSVRDSFGKVDDVLCRAANGITGVILNEGFMNVDFADFETIMSYKGLALMGIGEANGENSCLNALRSAIESPLLDNISINGAKGIIVNFEFNPEYALLQIEEAMSFIKQAADEDADIITGMRHVDTMPQDAIRATIIATGFEKDVIESVPPIINTKAQESQDTDLMALETARRVSGGDLEIDLETPSYLRNKQD